MKSNVSVKSNVYTRQRVDLSRDKAFLAQVRGREALVKILKRLRPTGDLLTSGRTLLTPRQIAELAWEQRCDICEAIPEGPVSRAGVEQIEFRCPRGRCKAQTYRKKTVLLDLNVVAQATAKTQLTAPEVVRKALDRFRPGADSPPKSGRSITRPFVLKLTPYEFYFLRDEEIESSLLSFIREETCQK